MRMKTLALLLSGIVLSSAVSCTVKELRTECPCWLQVSVLNKEVVTTDVSLIGWDGAEAFSDRFSTVHYPDVYEKTVTKGLYYVMGYEGVSYLRNDGGHSLVIDYGMEADSLYCCCLQVDATGEFADVPMTLRKQFATIHLDIKKTPAELERYSFEVNGGVCGFDLLGMQPVEGAFRCTPEPTDGRSVVSFRVPRQKDDSLQLTLTYDDGPEGFDMDSYPLGRYIRMLNYNWKSDDLQDIYITMDIISGKIQIGVESWEPAVDFYMHHVII